jgi:transcription initiation factor TFIID subunit 13
MPSRKAVFAKEIRQLMYGFGDVPNPREDSVNALDECLEWFVADLCSQATSVSQGKLKTSDFLTALANDSKKVSRAHELLYLDKELKSARAQFDVKELAKGGDQ